MTQYSEHALCMANAISAEKYCTYEYKTFGRIGQPALQMRRYWLKRLLEAQLKEFNREQD